MRGKADKNIMYAKRSTAPSNRIQLKATNKVILEKKEKEYEDFSNKADGVRSLYSFVSSKIKESETSRVILTEETIEDALNDTGKFNSKEIADITHDLDLEQCETKVNANHQHARALCLDHVRDSIELLITTYDEKSQEAYNECKKLRKTLTDKKKGFLQPFSKL